MGLLSCTKCKESKPETSAYFPKHNKKKNGLDSWCRDCRKSYRSGIRRGNYRTMISDSNLRDVLETTLECVICGETDAKGLAVDHCHHTNTIRGVLCQKCNMGLGLFRDDPQLLEFARIYLLAHTNDTEAEEYIYGNQPGVNAQPDREAWNAKETQDA